MAQVLKRCGCDRSGWAKCQHSWTVRYWSAGGQREKSFKRNHKQAVAFSKRIEAAKLDVHRGDPEPPVTFGQYADDWLASGPGSAGTVRIYGQAVRLHLRPAFGNRQLAAVAADREGVASFLKGLSASAARICYTALRAMLGEAQRAGRIPGHRLSGIRLDAAQPLRFTFPSHEQLTALAGALPEELRPAVWIMHGCGLRPAEVLAVRGESLSGGRLRVSEQQYADGSRGPLKARKPSDFRDVPVPQYVADAIGDKKGYLFSVTNRKFNTLFAAAAKAAGLPGFRPHDLRHVFASVALQARVPVTDVARFLGHRNIQVTYRAYAHMIPSGWDTAIEALDAEHERWAQA